MARKTTQEKRETDLIGIGFEWNAKKKYFERGDVKIDKQTIGMQTAPQWLELFKQHKHPEKVGRPLNCEPEDLLDLFNEYRKELRDNPIMVPEQKRSSPMSIPKDASPEAIDKIIKANDTIVLIPHRRPLSLSGFETWCWDEKNMSVAQYFDNHKGGYDQFTAICTRIRKTIEADHTEGGMVGLYKASVTQRLNNWAEKTENVNVNKEVPLFPDHAGEDQSETA